MKMFDWIFNNVLILLLVGSICSVLPFVILLVLKDTIWVYLAIIPSSMLFFIFYIASGAYRVKEFNRLIGTALSFAGLFFLVIFVVAKIL